MSKYDILGSDLVLCVVLGLTSSFMNGLDSRKGGYSKLTWDMNQSIYQWCHVLQANHFCSVNLEINWMVWYAMFVMCSTPDNKSLFRIRTFTEDN